MRYVLILLLAAALLLLMHFKKAYRSRILLGALLVLFLGNLFFSLRDLEGIVPFTSTKEQLFYNADHPEETYPGAILPLIVSGKRIRVKDDITRYEFDMSDPVAPWELHLGEIYYGLNSKNLLAAMGAELVPDSSINDVKIEEDAAGQFTVLGASNDLYRFSCAANDIPEEYGNYFHYYYYYTAHGRPMYIYLNADDVSALTPAGEEELVALWQRLPKGCGENLFIMSRDYYDREVAK